MPPDPFPPEFSIIDGKAYTAWTMYDGHVMCGTLTFDGIGAFRVRRVDGGAVTVEKRICRPATVDDIQAACRFFGEIGKCPVVPGPAPDPKIPNLNGCEVYLGADGTLFIELPAELQRPIDRCCCRFCQGTQPKWDMLAVNPNSRFTWTVHFPRKAVLHALEAKTLHLIPREG